MDYSLPPTQNFVTASQLVEIPCLTSLPRQDSSPIEFRVDKTDLHLDPTNVFLHLKCQFVDLEPATTPEQIFPTNNLAYSMFSNVEMSINDQKITQDSNLYPWLTYIICLTQYSKQYRNTVLASALWKEDQYGTMDTAREDNSGAVSRKERTDGEFELYSKVITDHIQLSRLLPAQCEVMYKFIPNKPAFYINAKKGNFTLKIVSAKLYVMKVKLSSSLPKQLHYPVSRFFSRVRIINKGEQNIDYTAYSGKRPRRLYLTQITQQAYNGDLKKNIFNLMPFNLHEIQVYFNDLSLPVNTSTTMSSTKDILRMYFNTAKAVNNPLAWDISIDAFADGFFLYVVDLTSDLNANSSYISQTTTGSVRVNIAYSKPLSEAIALLCFAEFDDILTIDSNNNVRWM